MRVSLGVRSIHFWLRCLVLASILPAILVAAAFIIHSYEYNRASIERDNIGIVRALAQAVDAELIGVQSALQVLASSPYLISGDLAKFYGQASEILHNRVGYNIVLTDIEGQQLLNTLVPFGDPLPLHGNMRLLHRTFETSNPGISDLFIGTVRRRPVIAIEVPVISQGKVIYALAMGITPDGLGDLLRRQRIPSGWVATIFDSAGTVVARTQHADRFIGKEGAAPLVRRMATIPEGVVDSINLDGMPVLSVFSRSSVSSWVAAIGIPTAVLTENLSQSLQIDATAALVLIMLGVLLAHSIGRRMSRAIGSLSAPALALGSSKPISIPQSAIKEVDDVGAALSRASELIRRQEHERDELRRRLMRAQEEERLRLARELHDEAGQGLAAAMLELKRIEQVIGQHDLLRNLRSQLDEMGKGLHRVARELRPSSIDELGLARALAAHAAEWSERFGIEVDYQCVNVDLDALPDDIRTVLYRICQEALTNVGKHAARATTVGIIIEQAGGLLRLTIEDNGCGFDASAGTMAADARIAGGLGLAGIRERLALIGGELEIESSAGVGTTIFVRIMPQSTEESAWAPVPA